MAYVWDIGKKTYVQETEEQAENRAQVNEDSGNFWERETFEPAETTKPEFDKNTPSSLKQLRWAIYEAVDHYPSKIKTMGSLKMEIEALFKEYTNS